MRELTDAELLQATALALLRHSVTDRGGGTPVLAMTSSAFDETSGRLEVTYARRSEPAVFTRTGENGTERYTCAANHYVIVLTPAAPIYTQEEGST